VKVNPSEVENVMTTLAPLAEVAVFGVPGDDGIAVVCAAVVPAARFDADAFHARCRERLGLKAPALIMHMRELPRNANGKVLRSELVRIALASDGKRKAMH
jgi:acyl-CoA synthetase (AMP-forming)/AMP-acid ligase II